MKRCFCAPSFFLVLLAHRFGVDEHTKGTKSMHFCKLNIRFHVSQKPTLNKNLLDSLTMVSGVVVFFFRVVVVVAERVPGIGRFDRVLAGFTIMGTGNILQCPNSCKLCSVPDVQRPAVLPLSCVGDSNYDGVNGDTGESV